MLIKDLLRLLLYLMVFKKKFLRNSLAGKGVCLQADVWVQEKERTDPQSCLLTPTNTVILSASLPQSFHHLPYEGSQGKNFVQEPRGGNWCIGHGEEWLATHCLLSLLFYTTQPPQARDSNTHSAQRHPTSIINKDNALQTCLQQPSRMEAFLHHLRFPLPRWPWLVPHWQKTNQYLSNFNNSLSKVLSSFLSSHFSM